jgi:hypothetical protein
MSSLKLKVNNIYIYTNLEVRLKSRTTKEEANKEVERMIAKKKIFEDYEWKIEGCENCGINIFDEKLKNNIIERLEQDETDENIFWDGFTAHYDLNVGHILVNTNLEVLLKSSSKEEAILEVKKICLKKDLFEDYEWKIESCEEAGINEFSKTLKNEIIEIIVKDLEACIEECNV